MESNPLYNSEGVTRFIVVGLPGFVAYIILRRLVPKIAVYFLVAILCAILYFEDDVDAGVRRYWPPASFHAGMIEPQDGKVFLVTGGNVGLGRETALVLAEKGATVVIGCRSNWEAAAASITRDASHKNDKKHIGGKVIGLPLDLADSASIHAFANHFKQLKLKKLDGLIFNAGVMTVPTFTTTKDGLETQIGTNWIGHFYLQELLEEELIKSAPSRVVIVSAKLHNYIAHMPADDFQIQDTPINRKLYGPTHNYAMSKLLNIMHAKVLSERLKGKGVAVVSLHPGVIDTSLSRFVFEELTKVFGPGFASWFRRIVFETAVMTPHEGALTQLWAATAKEVETDPKLQGAYFRPLVRITEPTALALNKTLQLRAWDYGQSIIAKFPRKV